MEIENVPIVDIVPYERNPRKNDKAVDIVAKSIQNFGFLVPVVLDDKNTIVAGHTRIKAAIKLGLTEVPVIYTEGLTDAQIKAFRIMDNKSHDYSTWDFDLLKEEIELLKGLNVNLDLTGFGELELDKLFPENSDDEFIIPKKPKYNVKPGEIYELGNHRLMCGDSTAKENVDKLMNGQQAKISVTSPPYNVGSNELGGNKNKVDSKYNSYDDAKPESEWFDLVSKVLIQNLLNSRYCFYNIQQLTGNKIAFIDLLYQFKDQFVDNIIWFKGYGEPAMAENVLNSRYENILIFKNEKNPNRTIDTGNFRGTVSNVYEGSGNIGSKFSDVHAAAFPLHLPSFLIKSFSQKGDIVLDLFGGSGTTLIACEENERICYMMELDPVYCSVIIQRWEEFTKKLAKKL